MSNKGPKIQTVKGMKDVLPEEQKYWNLIRQRVADFAKSYGFERIDTPIVEATNLFKRSVGEYTDIVTKEMYSFVTQGGDKVSLRPENTASIVRAYVEHGMISLPQPVKLYYIGPFFRYDKPQAGRYRQFWQFGFEILGEQDPVVDAQLIIISHRILKELGLDIEVHINSVGDDKCRPGYLKVLKKYYQDKQKDLCPDCKVRLQKNPLRLLDCKNKKCQSLVADAPQLVDNLCETCKNHFMMVLEYLDEADIEYNLNPTIVRGLDYYTKTAWEILIKGDEEAVALGGGGRYDDLVAFLGGRATPAVGFAMGIERIVSRLQKAKIEIPAPKCDLYIAQLGLEPRKKALKMFEDLREAGLSVAESMSKKGLKDQLEAADKYGAKYTLILGSREIADGTVLIRDMESGIQEVVDYKKIRTEIAKRLNSHVTKSGKIRKS